MNMLIIPIAYISRPFKELKIEEQAEIRNWQYLGQIEFKTKNDKSYIIPVAGKAMVAHAKYAPTGEPYFLVGGC